MKRTLAFILAAVMLVSTLAGCSGSGNDKPSAIGQAAGSADTQNGYIQGSGYDKPEEALLAYAEARKEGDYDKMISTFAIESFVDHFDDEAYYAYMKYFPPNYFQVNGGIVSNDSESGRALSFQTRRNYVVTQIAYQYQNLLGEGTVLEDVINTGYRLEEGQEKEVTEALAKDPGFSEITIGAVYEAIDFNSGELLSKSERVAEIYDRYKKIYGAEDIKEYYVQLTINGEDYVLFGAAFQYDGKWYMGAFMLIAAALNSLGANSGGLAKLSYFNK